MKYNIGTNVVHLSHGIGTVIGLETREFGPENVQEFYIIQILDQGTPKKVFVPLNAASTRLRPVSTPEAIEGVFRVLRQPAEFSDASTWNMRYREYMAKIASGSSEAIASVFNTLYRSNKEKDLSFGERKLLDQALYLLTKEIALSLNVTATEAEGLIEGCFEEKQRPKLRLVF